MKLPHVSGDWLSVVMVLLVLGSVLSGCSQKANLALDTASFNAAPPELREKWKAAAADASKKNYLGATTNLIDIFSKAQQLTPEQNDALNQAWLNLGNQAFEAANSGNKNATEAILKMKESRIGNRRDRR